MPGPLHDTVTTTPRRADYGEVRLGRRDIDGLILCAEHYGAPYDLLAAALGAQPARLRGDHRAVAAGRVRRHRAAGTRPGLVLADPGRHGLPPGSATRPRRPALARLAHIRAVLAARLWLPGRPGLDAGPGRGGIPSGASAPPCPARRRPPGTCPTPRSTGPA